MATVASVVERLEEWMPLDRATHWDNVGLLLGDRTESVERVMTCLTVTPETVGEAIAEKAQLIVTHHPVLFRAVKRLTADTAEGRMIQGLVQNRIAVYSPHTAFDNAPEGINQMLAARLGLASVEPLRATGGPALCKLTVFVPEADLPPVSDALFRAGAGEIGQYRECSFRLPGTGTFYGSDATNPAVGQKGRREEVAEWRLEVVCPEDRVPQALHAVRNAHSYEEPAVDVYPLRPSAKGGEGRVGTLPAPMALVDLGRKIERDLKADRLQMVGDTDRRVSRVAICCGAGAEFMQDALRHKADVLLTGEARFHDCLAAQAQGLALLLPGHYASERFGMEVLAERLGRAFPDLTVWPSRRERDPLRRLE